MATQDISQLVVEVKSKGIQTAANQLEKLATSSDKAEAAVKKLGTAVVGVNGTLTGGVANAAALVSSITALTAVMERLTASQTRATASTRTNNEVMREAHALARGLSGSLGMLWVTYGNLAGMGVGIALGASLKGIVTTGKDVEHTLESIRVLGEASTAEIDKMAVAVTELGKGTQGPKEVAEALQVLTLAGLNAKQAMSGVQAALNLSVAGGVSVEKSAETLVQVSTALGYTARDFDHVGDVIAKTAAVSMSSVDSISNAFKSAAAVGEVYGASLQDIALGLAAVANLGIQGTSAGTALKNFYKDLSASTEKVTGTLRAMGLTIASFRDENTGKFRPLLDVVKTLDEGFNRLSQTQKKLAEVKMFSQQGVREFAVLSKLLHTASDEFDALGNKYNSKLEEMADKIDKAAAFSTLAAIAMAQTTSNQLKSVGNTLQSTFTEVFKEISPQIGQVARSLKAAFASPEFKAALVAVATAIANITKFVVENASALATLAAAWWGAMRLAAIYPALQSIATGLTMARVAALGLSAALGPIGITIAALTTAWYLYKRAQDDALNNQTAAANLNEYNDGIVKAAEKEQRILAMRKAGKTQADMDREEQMQSDKDAADQAIRNSQRGLDAMKAKMEADEKSLNVHEKLVLGLVKQGTWTGMVSSKIESFIKQEQEYTRAMDQHANQVNVTRRATEKLIELRKQNAVLADEDAKKTVLSTGTGMLPVKGNKAGENDRYASDLQEYQNSIKAAYQELANFREMQNSKFRSGEIGKLQLIDSVAQKELDTYDKVAKKAAEAMAFADSKGKKADASRFEGQSERAEEELLQADRMHTQARVQAERDAQAQLSALKVKALEEEGKYVEAAKERWSQESKVVFDQIAAEAARSGGIWEEMRAKLAEVRAAAEGSAQLKEDTIEFNAALSEVQGSLKGMKSEAFGSSVSGLMDAAVESTKKYEVALKKAQVAKDKLEKDAKGNKPEAVKALNDANKELLAAADKQKTMWIEVGQTITDSLTGAFGKYGQALGEVNEAVNQIKYSENASAEDRMKQYGDLAGAASGFFDKQSKGYKVLNGISQAFHIAQLARTAIQTTASIIAGAAQFFAQSGWAGFAGVAAMGVVLASLGHKGGTGGGVGAAEAQKTQGTGTVFGDSSKKSESITKSLEFLKSNSDVMLPLTEGMLAALRNIEASMTGLTNLVIRTNGITEGTNMGIQTGKLSSGETGLLGVSVGITKALGEAIPVVGGIIGGIMGKVSSLWGSTKQNIVDSGLQFGGKVSDLQGGVGFNQYASVDTTKKSMFGLKKSTSNRVVTQGLDKELSSQFGLVFSNLEDALKLAAGGLGKNAADIEKSINNVVLSTSNISLKGLKGEEITAAINAVMSKAMDEIAMAAFPQMDAFRQVGEGYAQTVIRVASASEQASLAMEQLGLKAIDYTQVLYKQGDVAVEIAKQTIAMAEGNSGINEMLKGLGGSLDDLVKTYQSLVNIRKQMNLLGLQGNKLDVNAVKGAGGISKLSSALSTYQDKYFTEQEKSAIMLKSVTDDFNKLGIALPASKAALRALIEQTGMGTAENAKLTGQLLALADAYDKATAAADEARDSQMSSVKSTIDALKQFLDSLKEFRDSLALGSSSILTPTEKYLEAKRLYDETMSKAMAGDQKAKDDFTGIAQAFLDASRVINASSQGYTDTYNTVMADIAKLSSATETQLTNAEAQLKALQDQVGLLEALNTTAQGIQNTLSTVAPPTAPNATVNVDTAALEAEITKLRTELAEANAAHAKQMDDLMAVVYDSQTTGADKVADAVITSTTGTVWADKTGKLLDYER